MTPAEYEIEKDRVFKYQTITKQLDELNQRRKIWAIHTGVISISINLDGAQSITKTGNSELWTDLHSAMLKDIMAQEKRLEDARSRL